MKKHIVTIAAVVAAGLIAGCGGGGSTPATSSTVSGAVADGYLVGATVFLDKDGNYRWDDGEPSTTTAAGGAYTLTVDPADVGKYPIVAMALKGVTIDEDTPNQFVQNSYILSMPKESVSDSVSGTVSGTVSSNFISPMSTQIRELMETDTYTMQQAMDEVSSRLGLPVGTNMLADYMTDPNNVNYRAMHTAAQNMAGLMGSQMGQVLSNPDESTTTVYVNRYRGMVGMIFRDMSSIKGSGPSTDPAISTLMATMAANLPGIMAVQPYRNMSTSFRGGMMGGGTRTAAGGRM